MRSECQNVSSKRLSDEALKPTPNLQLMAPRVAISSDTHFILICRQTIRMSLLCPHWAAAKVNEQQGRLLSLAEELRRSEGGRG